MKRFNKLFRDIDQTSSTNKKVEAMVNYFRLVPAEDILWSVYLLIGKSSGRVVKTSIMRQATIHLSQIPAWLFEESYHVVGDLAETIALSLPPPIVEKAYTLSETMNFLSAMPALSDEEKEKVIKERWMETAPEERFIFNKLITGNFRMGVSKQLVIRALATTYSKPVNELIHRLMGNWHPNLTTLERLLVSERSAERSYEPYPFFLAYPLDQEPAKLGDVQDWFVERKYDGIRGQIIVRNQEIYIWSRGEDLLTAKFPEFHPIKLLLPSGTVIDGEILPYRDKQILPFAIMQTRIGRKNLSKKILDEAPLVMICYDLLEHNGQDIRQLPMLKRRSLLQLLLKDINMPSLLQLSPLVICKSWEEVKNERTQSRNYFCEGLMLKRKDSVYETGRRRGNWWKWKVDPYTVDGVLIYAQRGHGRRANLYTDYTFAVWDDDVLVPFAKAYSGLTDKEILAVDTWVKRHTIDKFGPVRSVTASLVFELAFEGISASPRHKSGIALRFPRILRWRKDKTAKEANTKADLLAILKGSNST